MIGNHIYLCKIMKKVYIYESPDKGKTIFRREFGVYGKREKKIEWYAPAAIGNPITVVWVPEV